MYHVILVDDEPLALEILESYVNKIPDLHLVGTCSNAIEANALLRKEKVDLMFLDIQMPQLTGIDFLKSLSDPPLVIFTTAFSNYALEGFELNAIDYLLKPISFERFLKAVNKAIEHLSLTQRTQVAETVEGTEEFFFVKSDKKLVKVNFSDILYIEGLKDYVIIRLENSRVIALQTMKSLEDRLPRSNFIRIHRSYIVNLDKIQAIVGNMVEVLEKNQPKHLPIGNNYKDELNDLINQRKL